MQLKNKDKKCIALEGSIKRPICEDCITIEMEDWLRRRRPGLIPSLKKKATLFFDKSGYSTHIICSVCDKKINTCDFCFRQYMKKWIEERYPRLLAEFRLFFDFR